jgi:hypothetical protein
MVSTPTRLKERLRAACPKPRIELQADLRVVPISADRSLIGTAFDYLLRFQLARWNPSAITSRWVAEAAANLAEDFGEALPIETAKGRLSSAEVARVAGRMRRYIAEAQQRVEGFVRNGRLTDDLIRTVIRLAQCDMFYRALQLDPQFGRVTVLQVRELRALLGLVKSANWRAKQHCLLNPNFGKGSMLIGGADADVLIDDLLIEVKTTAVLEIKATDWRQLFGYAALNEHFPIGDDGVRRPIRRLGVYFARYGLLHTWSIEEIVSRKDFGQLARWLRDHLRETRRQRIVQTQSCRAR